MKTGKTIVELAQEIDRRANAKRDYIVDTSAAKVRQIEATNDIALQFSDQSHVVNNFAHGQIASHTGIPKPYYDKMRAEAPALLASNVETWFAKYPAPRMVRCLDDNVRAFLSDRYRRDLENEDIAEAALPVLADEDLTIMSCEITDRRLYIKAVSTKMFRDVPTGRRWGDGTHTIFDTCAPAVTISNSEVGAGALNVEAGYFTRACTNLAMWSDRGMKKYHVGGRAEALSDNIYALLSDKTRALTSAAIISQLRDVVKGAFDEAKFDASIADLAKTAERVIDADPVKVVERLAKRERMTQDERGSVLAHLIKGGDLTQYGLLNAVTRTAEDLPSYDRATEFERLGGKMIDLSFAEWKELVAA